MVIRLGAGPEVREVTSKAAEDLQRRYDLLFHHLETPKPARLTAAVRWGISNSKIPAYAWKSPVPTQVIEDYLADEPDYHPAPLTPRDWVEVVNEFISKWDHLEKAADEAAREEADWEEVEPAFVAVRKVQRRFFRRGRRPHSRHIPGDHPEEVRSQRDMFPPRMMVPVKRWFVGVTMTKVDKAPQYREPFP